MLSGPTDEPRCPLLHHLNEQRYVLSVILSYLNETDGTSLLITNKTWSRRMLPLFQLPDHLVEATQVPTKRKKTDNVRRVKQARHRFIVMPIQDSSVLLAKLNTRRLSSRIRKRRKSSDGDVGGEGGGSFVDIGDQGQEMKTNELEDMSNLSFRGCFPLNMTTDEIAWNEWNQARIQYVEHSLSSITVESGNTPTNNTSNGTDTNSPNQQHKPKAFFSTSQSTLLSKSQLPLQKWEAKLELLRYRIPPPTYKIPRQNPSSIFQLPPKILSQVTLLTSYPRSGNTLLRNLLERITNIVTGSDTRPDRTLSKSLALDHDLVGEGIVQSNLTPVIKTHFPERRGYMVYNASRVILLVRNPYDAIDSYWNMCCTNTHTESVVEDIYDLYQEKFRDLAKSEICTWLKFVKFWLNKGNTTFEKHAHMDGYIQTQQKSSFSLRQQQRPSLLVIRFEDLLLRTECVMEQVISFMLNGNSNMDSELHPFWKWRIRHGLDLMKNSNTTASTSLPSNGHVNNLVPQKSSDNVMKKVEQSVNTLQLGSYKPRSEKQSPTASIGKSIRKGRYSQDILSHFQEMANQEEFQMEYKGRKINLLELFEYELSNQNFPFSLDSKETEWSLEQYISKIQKSKSDNDGSVRVNIGPELRPKSSPFGRPMTTWRKSQTANDCNPFPTVKK